jgi:hypothetical protein
VFRSLSVGRVVFGGADGGVGDLGHAEQGGKDECSGNGEDGAQSEDRLGGGVVDRLGISSSRATADADHSCQKGNPRRFGSPPGMAGVASWGASCGCGRPSEREAQLDN